MNLLMGAEGAPKSGLLLSPCEDTVCSTPGGGLRTLLYLCRVGHTDITQEAFLNMALSCPELLSLGCLTLKAGTAQERHCYRRNI